MVPPPGPDRPGGRPAAVTVKDVAARAGVSVGTVSNVLNADPRVRTATRERVRAAIADLGFVPNESARHLRAGRSRVIALVVPDIANPFFHDVAAGADDSADLVDAMVVVSSSASSAAREERHLRRLGQQRLLGLAITPMFEPPWELLETIEAQGTPVVLVDHTPEDLHRATVVTVDDHLGGRLAGEHLLAAGHQRIAYLAPDFQQTRAREAGLREAVGDQARVDLVRCSAMTLESGASAVDDLLPGEGAGPTAVFCGNDLIALGLLGRCLQRGVRVPQDLAVVGYDDIELSAAASVPITTIRQPRRELGARAVELLLNDGGPSGPGHAASLLRPELVVRASSRGLQTSRLTR